MPINTSVNVLRHLYRFCREVVWRSVYSFAIFSSSMMNQMAKVVTFIIWGLLRRLNCSDFTNGPHRSQKWWSNDLNIFVNISKYMKNQRLIFDLVAVLDLFNKIYSLDLDCETHKVGFHNKICHNKYNCQNIVPLPFWGVAALAWTEKFWHGEVRSGFSAGSITFWFSGFLLYDLTHYQTWVFVASKENWGGFRSTDPYQTSLYCGKICGKSIIHELFTFLRHWLMAVVCYQPSIVYLRHHGPSINRK